MSNFLGTTTMKTLFEVFKRKSGLDLNAYKQNQMERRIRSFISTYKLKLLPIFLKP